MGPSFTSGHHAASENVDQTIRIADPRELFTDILNQVRTKAEDKVTEELSDVLP